MRGLENMTKKNLLREIGFLTSGGEDGNRTRLNGFAGRCITSLLPRQLDGAFCHVGHCSTTSTKREARLPFGYSGAGEEARTLDLNLGKVALYQLSYSRFARTRLSQKPTEFPRHPYIT